MTRVLLVDNYDSFTWNLAQAFMVLGAEVLVQRNDQITVEAAKVLAPTHVCISPGPGHPADAGRSPELLAAFVDAGVPLLGVCLGHQMIGHVYGGTVNRAGRLMHGKSSFVQHDGTDMFAGCDQPMEVARYHSLIVDPVGMPPEFEVTATTVDRGEVMALRSTARPIWGVQFHPESVLTPQGNVLLGNFLAFRR